MASRTAALVFGINYIKTPSSRLNGCINDANDVAIMLKARGIARVDVYDDETNYTMTTKSGIERAILGLSIESWLQPLDLVFIHYSGHGSYLRDSSGDERDGRDECLVPSDHTESGMITDDQINGLLRKFNPATRVVCVFDCCHSGTMCDLPWRYVPNPAGGVSRTVRDGEGGHVEVAMDWAPDAASPSTRALAQHQPHQRLTEAVAGQDCARIVMLSGCDDAQTSADAYGVERPNRYTGALTSCLLMALREEPALAADALALLGGVRDRLKKRSFVQLPQLTASYDLAAAPAFL